MARNKKSRATPRPKPPSLQLLSLERRDLPATDLVQLLNNINIVPSGIPSVSATEQVGGITFFVGTTPAAGQELWRTDGTSGGTFLVDDINPGPGSSYPSDLTNVSGELFFEASNGTERRGAVEERRHVLRDRHGQGHQPRRGDSSPTDLTNVSGELFFEANDGTHGYRALEERRHLLRHHHGQGHRSEQRQFRPDYLTNVGGELFFSGHRRHARYRSSGRATAPPPGPSWSRTSTPTAPGSNPQL